VSDANLRELERRWRKTGDVEDEAVWLLERVRAGELGRSELNLAAYCGHEAARRSLGSAAPVVRSNPRKFARRLSGRLSRDASLRAAIGLGELVRRRRDQTNQQLSHAILWTTRALLRRGPIENAHDAWTAVTGNRRVELLPEVEGIDFTFLHPRHQSPPNYSDVLSEALSYVEALGLRELSLAAMREDLVPWALGYSDPVRDRVEARLREAAGG